MKNYPTPHINACPEDFGKTVLMPGDPLRSKFIAENFLKDARLVNNVRGVQGYTGTYNGVKVSVMASGMGIPSMAIYSYELFNNFGVENIIRVGSAGSINEGVKMRDLVLGLGACTNSNFADQFNLPGYFAPVCSYKILQACASVAKEMGVCHHVGNLVSVDNFYDDDNGYYIGAWKKMGVLAVEMEAAGLYMNASRAGKNALAICTVSDDLLKNEHLSHEERQTTFSEMIELALKTAVLLDK